MQYEALPNESGGIFLNIGRQDGFVPFQINSATVIIHYFISKDERACSRDSHACPCHDNTSTMLYRWSCILWIICSSLFFSTLLLSLRYRFIFVSSVHKHSSKTLLAHLCAFLLTLILPCYFWCWSEVCILLCSICNSVSKSPEDRRLSENHPSFLEVDGDFTDTSFRVHFHSFYDLSVINYRCFLSRSGRCWLLVVYKLLLSPCPLYLL